MRDQLTPQKDNSRRKICIFRGSMPNLSKVSIQNYASDKFKETYDALSALVKVEGEVVEIKK